MRKVSLRKIYQHFKIIKTCFLMILFFGFYAKTFSQNEDFNEIYYKTATDYMFSDPDRAIKIADSLYFQSVNENQEMRSLMLKAAVYLGKPDLKKARDIALEADKIAVKAQDYIWQFRIKGFIASIYQKIHFVNEGMQVLHEMDDLLTKIESPTERANLSLLNTQSKANLLKDQVSPDSLLFYLNEGRQFYELVEKTDKGNYFIAFNEHLLGLTYYELKEYEKSRVAFHKVTELLKDYNTPNYHLYGFVYAGLGGIAYQKDADTVEADYYFSKVLNLLNTTTASERNEFLLRELRDYYQFKNNPKKSSYYDDLLTQSIQDAEQERIELAKDFVVSETQQSEKLRNTMSFFYLIIVFLSLLLFYLMLKLYKLNHHHKEVIIPVINDLELNKEEDSNKSSGIVISAETEKSILQKLESFEKEKMFLDPNLNIEALTVYCQTNNRYLSEVIKKKDKDFHAYVNRLRIEYIVDKLKSEPIYRNYKIAVLAEKSGFSSYGAFSSNFKNFLDVTPSTYIKELNSNN